MPEPEFTSDYDEMFKETISKPDNQGRLFCTVGMGSILKDVRAPQISEEGDWQYFSRGEENQRELLSFQTAHCDIHHLFILAMFLPVIQMLYACT